MKKKFYSLLFTATMAIAAAYAAEPVPYEYTFSGGSLGDWTQVDNNGGYPYWQGHQNGAAISIEMGYTNDDYLVSPEIALQAGKTYEVAVEIHEKAYTMDAATVDIVCGTGDDVTTYTSAGTITLAGGTTPSVQLSVGSDGNYKIALHCTSTGVYDYGSGQLFISSVAVTEAEEGGGGDDEPQSVAVPYSYTFSSATFDEGWSQYNANGDQYYWTATDAYVYSYTQNFGFGTVTCDDYLFSPAFSLEAGTTYEVTVVMNNATTTGDIDVMYGTSDDGSGYTSVGKLEVNNGGGSSTVSFSVPQSGEYKIALHDISAPELYSMSNIYLTSFDIKVGEEGGSDEPQGVAVPYNYTFSTATFDDGWTKHNANGDNKEWSANESYVYNNIKNNPYLGGVTSSDDYLFSPAFALEAETSYTITVTMPDDLAAYDYLNEASNVDVMYGTSSDGSGYTSVGKLEVAPGATSTVSFTVPQSGNYKIAFHDISAPAEHEEAGIYLITFDIKADEGGGGDTPAEVTAMPYNIDFTKSSDGWTAVNVDGDNYTWGENLTNGGYAVTATNNGSNDWFVSPLFHFVEGNKYQVDVNISTVNGVTDGMSGAQQIKVMFGDNEYTPATQLCTATGYLATGMQATASVEFVAPATGDYPLSVVSTLGGSNYNYIYLANFSIVCTSEQGGGDTPAEITLPYTQEFLQDLGDWTTEDGNSDFTTWMTMGSGAFVFGMGPSNNDDWLISPEFKFNAGNYSITISKEMQNAVDGDAISIYVGTGEDLSTYTEVGKLDMTATGESEDFITFPLEAGNYKVAIRNTCPPMSSWYIKSITIDNYTAPVGGELVDKDFTADQDIDGWTIIDGNTDKNQWQFVDGLSGISLTSVRGAQGNHNDWLISPEMAFEAGKSYVVTYTASTSGNPAPATLTVAYGSAPDAASMTNTIATRTINETDMAYFRITPETAGNYYLGFLVNSSANNGTVSVLTVKVAESAGITPLAPAGLAAEPNIQAGEVKLSWTNPDTDTENIALDGNITLRISRNGEIVEDITGQPGEAMSYIDRPTPFEGEAKYQVAAFVTEDKLSEAAETVANLNDFQGERSELYSWGGTYGGGFNDWTVINNNGGSTWTASVYNDAWYINYGKPSDDWLISPEVTLTTGRRYVIEVEVKSLPNYPAELEFYTGHGTSVGDMSNFVFSITAEGNGSQTYTSEQFTVDADGQYNLGVRAVNISTRTDLLKYTIYYYENNDTKPEEVPYTEDFTDADLAGWSLADGSTFAVADGALTSSQNGEPRSEIVYSPLINLKGGYTYEVTFDYAFDGADDGSTFTFYMADGQSETELIADSRLALDGTADGRCLFTPDEDGSYCLAWQIIAGADDDVKATIDNLAVGVKIYSALPYSEDFEGYAINEIPVGYKGITTVSDDNGNIAAEISAESGGASLWFNYEELRETYSLTLKYKKSDFSGWEINAVTAEGEKQPVGSIEGDANADWKEVTFAIPTFDGKEEAYGFRLEFSTFGESSLLIDDLQITQNVRAIAPAAPYNFRVYSNGMAAWNYPKTEADGYDLESATNVTVTIYDGDKELASSTGTPGSNGSIENLDFDDEWENDVKLIRATASVGGELGQSATWIIRKNDNRSWEYDGNILGIAEFDIDDKWQNNGWTIADGKATITEGEGSIVSPEFELKEGQIYLVRYYIDTDADAAADFSVKVGDASQTFTGARIGRNTYDWGGALPDAVGQYQYIDFVLPRIESTDDYNVTISAGNIGKSVSVDLVEIYEVREYPSTCEVPYENDFEDLAVELGGLEPNWSRPYYTNYWRIDDMSNYGTTAASGNRALVAPATTDLDVTDIPEDFVYTPYFVIEAGKTYSIEFDYYMPSAQTGLAFIYAYTPTYTEGEYTIIEEMGQATEWKHYSKTFDVEGADGTLIFGFVSYAAEVRDQATAIDNFKITEESAPGSVSEIAAGAAVTYHDGMLNVPADIESVAVYDMQGRMVISTTETGTISLEGLSDGVYVVKAVGTEGGAVQTLKIVK